MVKQSSSQGFYALLVLLGGASYGCVSAIVKIAYQHGLSAGAVTLSQFYFALVVFWLIAIPIVKKEWYKVSRADWIKMSFIGIFSAATAILYYIALYMLPAWLAMILLFQFSWMTFVIDFIATRKRPSKMQAIAIVSILVGTLLAVGIMNAVSHSFQPLGILFGLLSGLSYALFLYVNGLVGMDSSPFFRSAIITTVAALVVTLYEHPSFAVLGSMVHGWNYGLAIGIFSQAIPTLFFSIGIPRIGGGPAAILGSSELPVAVILSVVVLHELVSLSTWVGVILILVGIVAGEWSRMRKVGLT
nr:DMT family transporter [Bacilli bacterium]